jgi:cytochrome c peroxidase
MRSKFLFITGIILLLALIPVSAMASPKAAMAPLTDLEILGEFLYFDPNLSEPAGQSCASCHDPAFGFDDPDAGLPVSEGVIPGLFGGRNSPISRMPCTATMYFDREKGCGLAVNSGMDVQPAALGIRWQSGGVTF